MRTWNRTAVVVVPKQAFLDWLRSVDDTNANRTLAEVCDEPTVYLLPECRSNPEAAKLLANGPSSAWFSYNFHSMIVDLTDDPLIAEACQRSYCWSAGLSFLEQAPEEAFDLTGMCICLRSVVDCALNVDVWGQDNL